MVNNIVYKSYFDKPPPVFLRSAVGESIGLIGVGLSFLALSYWARSHSPNEEMPLVLLWCWAVFCIGPILVGGWQLIFPSTVSLILDKDHFSTSIFGSKKCYKWKDVSEFTVFEQNDIKWLKRLFKEKKRISSIVVLSDGRRTPIFYGPSKEKLVSFNDYTYTATSKASKRKQPEYNSVLPNNYGMTAEQLVELMNHWRKRAIESQHNEQI